MSDRYIPSVERVLECAKELPPANSWRDEQYMVPISDQRSVSFRRIKVKVDGGKEYRWIYEGKVFV